MNIKSAGKEVMNILDYNFIKLNNNTEGGKSGRFLGFAGSDAQKILSPCKTNKTYR